MSKRRMLMRMGCWLAVTAAAGAAEIKPESFDGQRVRDPKDKKTPAVEIWTTSKTAAAAELGNQRPGLYRLTLRGRFMGEPQVRYPVTWSVDVGGKTAVSETFWANRMPSDGEYHDARFELLLPEGGAARLSLSCKDSLFVDIATAAKKEEMRALGKTAQLDEKRLLGDDGNEADAGDQLEDTPIASGAASFLLASASLERLPAPLVLTRVESRKIHYYPEEQACVDVELSNLSDKACQGELVVTLLRELDQSRELLRTPVDVAAGAAASKQVVFDTGEEYGYEVRAEIQPKEGGRELSHARSAVFGVSGNLFELSIMQCAIGEIIMDPKTMRERLATSDADYAERADRAARGLKAGYVNHAEGYAWAPDDFFNLSPAGEVWYSGTGTYMEFKRQILAQIRAYQRYGIKTISYAQPFAIGGDTIREFRKNPEFFAYGADGRPAVAFDYDLMKSITRFDLGVRQSEFGGGLNFFNLATVDRGIDAVIASWKMFGWDGVRYDNRYYRANNPITANGELAAPKDTDLDPYSARNVKRQKDRFWKEIGPRWLISHNNGYRFREKGNILGWDETVKDGLLCMDEETCVSDSPSSAWNPWISYMRFLVESTRAITALGGYNEPFPPGRGTVPPVDMLYYTVACAATGGHPTVSDVERGPAGHYGRFLTRYSAMIFARDIKPLEQPDTFFAFPAVEDGRLWWKDFANTRQIKGRTWYMFPLVVPPANPRIAADPYSKVPKELSGVKARLLPGQFKKAPRVFFLTAEQEPMQSELEVKASGDGFEVSLPTMRHFGMIVVETGGGQ